MNIRACLHCVDAMMPAGIDALFGPVYRACPHCHTLCLGCDGMALFPAIRGYTLDAVFNAVYQLDYVIALCDRCTGITAVHPASMRGSSTQDSDPWRDPDIAHRAENVLRELADTYYGGCKQYEAAPQPDSSQRVYWRIRLAAIADIGDKLAAALNMAPPDWEAMRDLATPDPWADSPEPGVNP